MNNAILTCFHKYTPFGGKYYEPILNYFITTMQKYEDEYDRVYILDSTWEVDEMKIILNLPKASIIRMDPHTRYYDVYKKVLPTIPAKNVLFLDNDMNIYRKGVIQRVFDALSLHAVASIYDTIGMFKTDKMNGKNKFCPYFFAARTDVLKNYLDCDWGPNLPEYETLGKLTEEILEDGIVPYEFEEDKSNYLFIGGERDCIHGLGYNVCTDCWNKGVRNEAPTASYDSQHGDIKSKDLGYMHIRSGSLPAYLLATKHEGDKNTYWKYIHEQPKTEYLRQCFWYQYMGGDPVDIYTDAGVTKSEWNDYYIRAKAYYCLP